MTDRLSTNLFPAYTYVPGKTPHPVREPAGHSYGQAEPVVDQFDPENWSECSAYLFGIDLFNAGFYWESHEQWEAVWHAVGRKGPVADFLKALIKLSAAGVKNLEGRPTGVQRHAKRAAELFNAVGVLHSKLCGFELEELERLAISLEEREAGDSELGFHLQPIPGVVGAVVDPAKDPGGAKNRLEQRDL